MIPVIILCGGLATRLYPVTQTIPKSLIEFDHKPFIYYQLDKLIKNNVTDVVLCVGKFSDMIKDRVGKKYDSINIQYSYDIGIPGTGGAIKAALPLLPDDFFVLYGDSYLHISLYKMLNKYKSSHKPILMSVYRNKNKNDTSNILYDGEIISYNKKTPASNAEHIDYGISIMNKSVFSSYPDVFDLSDLYSDFINKHQVASIEATIPFQEIGSFKGIKKFKKLMGR